MRTAQRVPGCVGLSWEPLDDGLACRSVDGTSPGWIQRLGAIPGQPGRTYMTRSAAKARQRPGGQPDPAGVQPPPPGRGTAAIGRAECLVTESTANCGVLGNPGMGLRDGQGWQPIMAAPELGRVLPRPASGPKQRRGSTEGLDRSGIAHEVRELIHVMYTILYARLSSLDLRGVGTTTGVRPR